MVKYVGAKCIKSRLDWTGNTDEDLRQWGYGLARVQQKQLEFFAQSKESMNRFVMADLTDDAKTEDSIQRLWWANRADLNTYKATHLMTIDKPIPFKPPLEELQGPHEIPHMLSDPHPPESKIHVENVLKSWGCDERFWGDLLYMRCSEQMQKHPASKDEFTRFEQATNTKGFPSRHHWYIQAKKSLANNATSLHLPTGSSFVSSKESPTSMLVASPEPVASPK